MISGELEETRWNRARIVGELAIPQQFQCRTLIIKKVVMGGRLPTELLILAREGEGSFCGTFFPLVFLE